MATVVEPVKRTGKRTKPAAVDQAIEQLAEGTNPQRRKIPLGALRRHPDNRQPTEAAIGDVAASMDRLGQIEAAIVRPLFGDTYEVISGETRWRAAERLGWAAIDCEVRQLTDAEALQVLAAANASRQDLTAIDKAKLIVRLCQPKSEGGGGMTREAAALMFDLQSGGAASNLVRLLELPDVWQQRIASGEIPQTFARELLRLTPLDAGVWVEVEQDWNERLDTDGLVEMYSPFESRSQLERYVDNVFDDWTRVIEKGQKQHCDAWKIEGAEWHQPCRFKITPELEAELKVIECVIDGETHRRATNVALYDSLQIPAIKAHVAKQRAKAGGGRDADGEPKKNLTPVEQAAEEKRRRAEADDKLERRIHAWRTAWLRELCARRIETTGHGDLAVRICMWFSAHVRQLSYRNIDDLSLNDFLSSLWGTKGEPWSGAIREKYDCITDAASLVAHWLRVSDRDGHLHPFPDGNVVDLSKRLKIDLDHEWCTLQSGQETDDRFRAFFELHNGEQLDALGKELGVFVENAKTKLIKVNRLTNRDRVFKLPKSLRLKELSGKAGA